MSIQPKTQPATEPGYCHICAMMVKNLKAHKGRVHTPAKDAERIRPIAAKNQAIVQQARQIYLKTKIVCSGCRKNIALGEIHKHFTESHTGIPTPDMEQLAASAQFPANRAPQKLEKPPKAPRNKGDDIFDRNMVVSGGAYGLGKNRRH